MGNPIPNPNAIIFLRTVSGGITACMRQLHYHGAKQKGVDYVTFNNTVGIKGVIFGDETTQLLFTDSFSGDMQECVSFVERMRKKNPNLIIILLALTGENHEVFDDVINYWDEDWGERLTRIVTDFQNGMLRRKSQI